MLLFDLTHLNLLNKRTGLMAKNMLGLLCSFLAVLQMSIPFSEGFSFMEIQHSLICQSPDVDAICQLKLTVSAMHTLTAYTFDTETDTIERGFPMFVNNTGDLEFVTELQPPDDVTLLPPIVADGVTQRNLVVFNHQLPGPTIIGYENQRVRIRVINDLLTESIAIHWHGQHVRGSPYSDGAAYVTQCPILPGNEFEYDFTLFPAGTYWYHSHIAGQRSNGMYGGLVVLPWPETTPDPPYEDLPSLHTLVFFELFPVNSDIWIFENELNGVGWPDPVNPSISYRNVPLTDGTSSSSFPFPVGIINSAGWQYTPDNGTCQRRANVTLPFFNVESGKQNRFRLVGAQVNYAYRFSIHDHKLQLAATDGMDVRTPNDTLVDYIIVYAGERYDFILDANQTNDNYLIVIETLEDPVILEERGYCIKAHRGYAVLHYSGAIEQLPADFDDTYDPITRCMESTCYAVNCPFEDYPSSYNISCISVDKLQLRVPERVPNDIPLNEDVFLNFRFINRGATGGGQGGGGGGQGGGGGGQGGGGGGQGGGGGDQGGGGGGQGGGGGGQGGGGGDQGGGGGGGGQGGGGSVRRATINGRKFLLPGSPLLSQEDSIPGSQPFCEYSQDPTEFGFGETCIHTYTTTTDTVEMIFMNPDMKEAHPIHLHGHHFRVLKIGYPTYLANGKADMPTKDIMCSSQMSYQCNANVSWTNGTRPETPLAETLPQKDTVVVPYGGYVIIRFPRNNWGWWMLHCHIEPHLLGGMAMLVNATSAPNDQPIPQGFPQCGNYKVASSNSGGMVDAQEQKILQLETEVNSFRIATIALGVICGILLLALVIFVVILILNMCCKGSDVKPAVNGGDVALKHL